MAVTRISTTEESASQDERGLSDYEKLRLEKIKRNEDRLKELGLFQTKNQLASTMKKKKSTNKKATISPELPQRRSSRKRKTVADYSYEQVIPMYEDDEEKTKEEEDITDDSDDEVGFYNKKKEVEDDYEASDEENDDDDDEEVEFEPPKKRSRPTKPDKVPSSKPSKTPSAASASVAFECVNPKGGLTLEYAKTGRSSCRKCRNKIDKGKPRVGMEAWIVGRNAITWQLPACLLRNLCCGYEKSNAPKGKCKVSHTPFVKGQLKIGIRCHTATSYYRIEAIGGVLANVVALMRTDESSAGFAITVDDIDGSEKLTNEDRQTLASVLDQVFHQNPETNGEPALPEETKSSTPEIGAAEQKSPKAKKEKAATSQEQPKVGAKTGAKGRVEWKFGGRSCYGTLIPRMETKTHCYARTHKGNVKTLAKGKDYWSMLE